MLAGGWQALGGNVAGIGAAIPNGLYHTGRQTFWMESHLHPHPLCRGIWRPGAAGSSGAGAALE